LVDLVELARFEPGAAPVEGALGGGGRPAEP
jgi:hypothetical protein